MKKYFLANGRMYYNSPFYSFIKTTNLDSIFEALNQKGIRNIQPIDGFNSIDNEFEFYVAMNHDSIVLMDNWFYSLFNTNSQYPIIDALGFSDDIFQFFVGDSDHSFGFKKYEEGKLVRNYQVSNLSYRKGDLKVEVDFGLPLKRESEFLNLDGEYEKTVNIAYEEGWTLPSDLTQIKSYTYLLDQYRLKKSIQK